MLIIRLLGAQAVLDGATGRIRTGSSRTLALLGVLIAHTGRPRIGQRLLGNSGPSRVTGKHSPICAGSCTTCGAFSARTILWRSLQVSSVGTTEGTTISI